MIQAPGARVAVADESGWCIPQFFSEPDKIAFGGYRRSNQRQVTNPSRKYSQSNDAGRQYSSNTRRRSHPLRCLRKRDVPEGLFEYRAGSVRQAASLWPVDAEAAQSTAATGQKSGMNPNPFAVRNAVCDHKVSSVRRCVAGARSDVGCNPRAVTWSYTQSGCTRRLNRFSSASVSPASVSFSAGQYAVRWFQAGPLPSPTRIEQGHCWLNKVVMALVRAELFVLLFPGVTCIKSGQVNGAGPLPSLGMPS